MNDLLSRLNDRQREAVLITEGPLIVLAGAGSGKTLMLTSRISYLIQAMGVPAHQVLAMTFTNKAAAEMRERVGRTLAQVESSYLGAPEIGTFHSVCVRLLRRELAKTPFSQPFVIYDDSDQLSLIKSVLRNLDMDEKVISPKAVQAGINRAKCDALEPHELQPAAHNIFDRQLKRVYEQYQKDLFANNALDFGEIICMPYRLLRDHEDLREKYRKWFRYIHVDEYQDTNRAQYSFLSMLASPTCGGHQNICVVGDEDQSIYKWRGADIRNILDFETDYPGARTVKLEQNYRSTQTVLAVAGGIIRNNLSRKDKTLWTENEKGPPVIHAQLADERAEAEMVVTEIKRWAETENRTYGSFAIFYRTNAQSRQFEDVLRRDKIPYQMVGGLRFYDRKEIKDILSYFKVILNPSDSVSLKRILNVPARGIGKTTVDRLIQVHSEMNANQSTTFWQVVQQAAADPSIVSPSASKKLTHFVQLLKRFISEQPNLRLSELYLLILDETEYVRELRQEATEESFDRIKNLEEFNTLLQEFEEDQLQTLSEADQEKKKGELLAVFIEQSSLASDADNMDQHAGSVKLMTLHTSKGLEFPVVFLVGMEEGLFPSIKPWEETPEEEIEEERRLCYVGVTRARERLYLMNVVSRRIWGNVNYQEPSRFFSEIPEGLVDFRDVSFGARSGDYRLGSSRQWGQHQPQQTSSSFAQRGSQRGDRQDDQRREMAASDSPRPRLTLVPRQSDGDWMGRQLNHPEYGKGTVVGSEGSGTDQKVTIQFVGQKTRKFLLRYISSFFG